MASARRHAAKISIDENLGEEAAGRAAIIVTELATNLLKYATGGEILLTGLSPWDKQGIEIVSMDRGQGIANIEDSLRDGYSTSGTPGNGLGAVKRLSDEFDAYSELSIGTVILSRIRNRPYLAEESRFILGAVCRAVTGETVCGDAWAIRQAGERTLLLIADGLGHGPGAADASGAAVSAFLNSSAIQPAPLLQDIHLALRGTRGAAAAIAAIDWQQLKVHFTGLGNIAGLIVDAGKQQSMVSHNGIVGHEARRFQTFSYALPPGSQVIMHSDGLSTHWNIDSHPGLRRRHPGILAAAVYREAMRTRDDASIVVVRRPA